MKRLLAIMLFIPLVSYSQVRRIPIEVQLSGLPDGVFFYLNENRRNIDSAVSKAGQLQFSYRKKPTGPQGLLLISKDRKQGYLLWVEDKPLKLKGTYGESGPLSAEGSNTQNEFKAYLALTQRDTDSLAHLKSTFKRLKAQNYPDSAHYKAPIDQLAQVVKQKNIQFLKTHRASVISTYVLLLETKRRSFSREESMALFALLDKPQQNSGYGQDILRSVHLYQNPQVGQPAPNFTLQDPNGKPVSLSAYKGKNVVLIFWSSWCVPCKKEVPQVKSAYEAYKDQNFVFLGVSLDENKDAWLQAITKDQITWINVSDLKGWTSEAALIYGVNGIPVEAPTKLTTSGRGKLTTCFAGEDLCVQVGQG